MSDDAWEPIGTDGTWNYSATTLSVFWPEAEHQKVIARWPHLSDHLGSTWDEHRQRTERNRALVDRMGHKVRQLPGSFSELEAFLAGAGVEKPFVDYSDPPTANRACPTGGRKTPPASGDWTSQRSPRWRCRTPSSCAKPHRTGRWTRPGCQPPGPAAVAKAQGH
jgi:hypothetical protein